MRWFLAFVVSLVLSAANPQLLKVKSVYLLPMSNGMEQYLANHLQAGSTYVVVTDPQAADAIFTDNVGPAFEKKMAELYPVVSEEEEDAEIQKGDPVPSSTFRRGRGVVFLVERQSRQVVWSTFEKPRDARPTSLDKTAKQIAERLKKDVGAK